MISPSIWILTASRITNLLSNLIIASTFIQVKKTPYNSPRIALSSIALSIVLSCFQYRQKVYVFHKCPIKFQPPFALG